MYVERAFCIFWWASHCHHYFFLFYIYIHLFFDCILFLIFSIIIDLMQWKLKIFILPHQILFHHHPNACHELIFIILFCHLLTLVCSGLCIQAESGSLLHLEQLLPSWLTCPTVFAILTHYFSVSIIVLLIMLLMVSNSLLSFAISINTFLAFCVLTLLP